MSFLLPLGPSLLGRGPSIAVPSQNVTNYYNPVRSDALVNQLYNNDGSVSAVAVSGAAGFGFLTSGTFPVAAATAFTFSPSAAAENWLINSARINFYNSATASAGTLVSSVTTGVTLSADGKAITCAAANVPVGATYAALNLKYAIEGNYANTNVIPSGAVAALMPLIMVNRGLLACCLSAYGAAGTTPTASGIPDLSENFLILNHGQKLFYRFDLDGTNHVVHRMLREEQTYYYNSDFQFKSWVLIPATTTSAETVGKYSENYASTPTANTYYLESDNSPAYKINGIFQGGNHGIPSWMITATAHGKTNANARGSTWSKGGHNWILTRIVDANRLVITHEITGPSDLWIPDTSNPGTGAFTHVSGASSTGTITGTVSAQTQLWPSLQAVVRSFLKDGSYRIVDYGIYVAKTARIHLDYNIPNAQDTLAYVVSQIGNAADIYYNHSSINPQVRVHLEYQNDLSGATGVRYEVRANQAHTRSSMWPSQHQALSHVAASTETLWFFAEGVEPFQAGETQSGGSSRDFAATSNISANVLEYFFDQGVWKPGSYWSDGIQRAPTLFMFGVKNSGGTWIKKFVMVNDDDEGQTSELGFTTRAGHLSGFNKFYAQSQYSRAMLAGDVDTVVGGFGPQHPTADAQGLVNFAYPKGGGKFGFRWFTLNGALSNYAIPVGLRFVGKAVRIVNRATTITVISTVVSGTGHIAVSSSGAGGFSAVLE